MEENLSNLKISGSGSAGGGKYDIIEVNGSGKIAGDIECNSLSCNGSSSVVGNVKSKFVRINGSMHLKGDVFTQDLSVNGSSNIAGNVNAEKCKIAGSSDIGGNLHVANMEIRGSAKVCGDCEAEIFSSHGAFKIGGLLNADRIDIRLYGNCSAREIGGEKIEVKRSDSFIFSIQKAFMDLFNIKGVLTADVIEGDDIYLEYTQAKIVRGKNVRIGSNCNIGLVEYKENIEVAGGSIVTEQKKI